MTNLNEWTDQQWRERNDGVIPEFRAANGQRPGAPLLLLTTIGARSGRPHVTPLIYMADGDRVVVFASKGGNPHNPAWYHNLVANPEVTVERGGETYRARARVAGPEERDRLYAAQVASFANFGEYQSKTDRRIPVVVLEKLA